MTDDDGEPVSVDDRIYFSFGIPPTRVVGRVFERNGKLMMATKDAKPHEATLGQVRKWTGAFYKI